MSAPRGVPEQDKLENQDPGVAYVFDEVTRATFPFPDEYVTKGSEKPAPKKRAAKKTTSDKDDADQDTDPDDDEDAGDAPAADKAPSVKAADKSPFATRELGS